MTVVDGDQVVATVVDGRVAWSADGRARLR